MERSIAGAAALGCGLAAWLGGSWGGELPSPQAAAPPPATADVWLDPALADGIRLVGHYAGEGVLQCSVGRGLPPGRAVGVSRGFVSDGMLYATVDDDAGVARVHGERDGPRSVVLRWHDAWPGEVGHCTAEPARPVAVDGWVERASGERVFDGEVGTQAGIVAVDRAGGFSTRCWEGVPCSFRVRAHHRAPWGAVTWVLPDGPTYGVVLVLDRPLAGPAVVEQLAAQVADEQRMEEMPDPLELALQDRAFPEGARFVVDLWRRRELRDRHSTAGLFEGLMVTATGAER